MPASGDRDEILRQIEAHHEAIDALETQLRSAVVHWPPTGFYTTFYIVAGLAFGIVGGVTSFLFNLLGSMTVSQDPVLILRVFGTLFLGKEALTTDNFNFLVLVLMVHFSVAALGGALFHVVVSRYLGERGLMFKILLGGTFGAALWLVNFYGIIVWLQPAIWGQAFILKMMPFWVAALTHIVYGLTIGALQPTGQFVAYRPATQA